MCNLNALREKEVFALDYDGVVALLHQTEARLAEAERLLTGAAEELQLQHDPEDSLAMRNRILAFLPTTVSAPAATWNPLFKRLEVPDPTNAALRIADSAEEVARMSDGYGMTLQPLPRN